MAVDAVVEARVGRMVVPSFFAGCGEAVDGPLAGEARSMESVGDI